MSSLFDSVIESAKTTMVAKIDIKTFLLCTGAALILGIITALTFALRNTDTSRNFIVTTAAMPVVIEVVILVVNSLTAGIAIAGLFNLIRFRSVPGTSREITNILMATVIGVTTGMGYIGYGVIFTLLIVILNILMSFTKIGTPTLLQYESLRITVPESLDFEGMFDDILNTYTLSHQVERIKTTNMGSMYQITYKIMMKKDVSQKKMLDEIRVRNGNLDIVTSKYDMDSRKYL